MAVDVTHVTNLLIEKHLERLGEETELIFLFGSRQKGTAHPNSDVDLCYVPVQESMWAHTTVTVGDILFDLFPLHWSQLERMANFGDARTSLILDARIVHYHTEDALARFRGLQDRIRELMEPAARPQMVAKAQGIFRETGYPFLQLQLAVRHDDLPSGKATASQIVSTVTHCLMVLNQACIDTRKPAQVLTLPRLPEEFGGLLDGVYAAGDVQDLATTCEVLLEHTRVLLLAEQQALPRHSVPYVELFRSAYPEFKDMVQHILRGCEAQDPYMATDASLCLQGEVAPLLAQALTGAAFTDFHTPADHRHYLTDLGFPDLMPAVIARDYTALREQALAFDRRLRDLLMEQGVPLNDFADAEELRAYLDADPTCG